VLILDKVSTGILALDQILDGGLPKGSTILLAGRPGTGKTILAHQMMYQNAENDDKILYLTTLGEPQIKIMKFQQRISSFKSYGDKPRLQSIFCKSSNRGVKIR
jgi:circadian clock protein KaiC